MTTRVGFSTRKTNLASRVIRWITKSRASHAFLVYFDSEWDADFVMEATDGGVKITPYAKFQKNNDIVGLFVPRHPLDVGLKKAATEWLGEHFDYTGILGMIFVYLGHWLKMKWRNPFAASNSMFCSEFVARVLRWSSYPGTEGMEPEDTSPEDLLEFFEKERECA